MQTQNSLTFVINNTSFIYTMCTFIIIHLLILTTNDFCLWWCGYPVPHKPSVWLSSLYNICTNTPVLCLIFSFSFLPFFCFFAIESPVSQAVLELSVVKDALDFLILLFLPGVTCTYHYTLFIISCWGLSTGLSTCYTNTPSPEMRPLPFVFVCEPICHIAPTGP